MRPVVFWKGVLVAALSVAASSGVSPLAGCGGSGRHRDGTVKPDAGPGMDGGSSTADAPADRDAMPGRDGGPDGGPDGGQASVVGTINVCPVILSVSAAPAQAAVGDTIDVAVAATDPDAQAPLSVLWSVVPPGSIGDPAAVMTRYTCAAEDPQTITVSVSDGMCDDTDGVVIQCVGRAL